MTEKYDFSAQPQMVRNKRKYKATEIAKEAYDEE